MNDIRNKYTYIRDYTNFATFLNLMKTSNTYKLKQLLQFLFYAMSIKYKYWNKINSTNAHYCNALWTDGPFANKLTYLL